MRRKHYYTDSFQIASFLLSESIPLISTDHSNPKKIVFVFEESEKRQKLTEDFLMYRSKIEPHKLFNAQKNLKQLIYENNSS